VRQLRFRADAPGTYYYWGSTTGKPIDERDGPDSQLSGALIVDPPGTSRPPTDRVFVLGVWFRDADSTEPHPTPQQDVMVINGKSWPYTERIGLTQGDTVRWRWINPTAHSHPMHLHGFYFQVESRGDGLQDTLFAADSRPFEVTELMLPGGTMAMNWSPVRAGNWLFHCHFSFHISPDAGLPESSETAASTMAGPAHRHRMSGLVLGLQVKPRPGATAPHEVPGPERQIRLLVQSRPRHFGSATGFGYVLPEGTAPVPHDSIAIPGPMLLLHRDEPVRITVVNHLDEFTAVHWHGIELQSFPDGVPGWSGSGSALLSPIAPGDSFAAEFTPPRSGTFIYHTHANEMEQMTQGLYGPLVVLDPGEAFDSATDHVVIASPDGESTDTVGGLVNGSHTPAPIVMRVGEANRIRLINIHGDYRVLFSLLEDGRALTWRPLAKDGASVAPGLATPRPARLMTGPGETADFEVRFDTPGERALEVEAPYADRIWKVTLPIRVEAVKGQ
jgi:FtsP/CotA-like multicopper oxidase with cupredoxin domain